MLVGDDHDTFWGTLSISGALNRGDSSWFLAMFQRTVRTVADLREVILRSKGCFFLPPPCSLLLGLPQGQEGQGQAERAAEEEGQQAGARNEEDEEEEEEEEEMQCTSLR